MLFMVPLAFAEAPSIQVDGQAFSPGAPASSAGFNLTLAGELTSARALVNGKLAWGVALDFGRASRPDAWRELWKPNEAAWGAVDPTRAVSATCVLVEKDDAVVKGNLCECRANVINRNGTRLTITDEVCEGDGDNTARTWLTFGENDEAAAKAMFDKATATGGTAAVPLLEQVLWQHPRTRAAGGASRLAAELAVIGLPAPDLSAPRWLVGDPVDPKKGLVVLAFWETWDPHGKEALPELIPRVRAAGGVTIGITKVSKSSTVDAVRSAAPAILPGSSVFHDDGTLSDTFAVTGIPAVAVLMDGTVVWRGHPQRLDEATLARWGSVAPTATATSLPPAGVYPAKSSEWAAARDAVVAWCAGAKIAECPTVVSEFNRVERESSNRCNGTLAVRAGTPSVATVSTWTCNGGASAELVAQGAGWTVKSVGYDEGGD